MLEQDAAHDRAQAPGQQRDEHAWGRLAEVDVV
jgi:hypothetical protein